MKVSQVEKADAPGYPSRRQLRQMGAVLGLSTLGLAGCVTGGKMRSEPVDEIPSPPPIHEEFTTGGVPAFDPAPAVGVVATTYVVQGGDTLYALAGRFLGKGTRWPEIVAANPGLDARRIRPRMTLTIPPR